MKVLVTGIVPRAGLDELYANFEVFHSEGKPFGRGQVLEMLPDMDAVLLAGMAADREFFDRASRLKVIAVFGVGYDNVDTAYARQKGIAVCNSPVAVQAPTAELTISLMLAAARRIGYHDRNLRRGEWRNVSDPAEMGYCLHGATLGVLGIGRIGQMVARCARALGMNIIYHDQNALPPQLEHELCARRVDFAELLAESDVITIHAPLTVETRHLFGEREFRMMKKTAFIINAARGPIIDEDALVNALKNGEIAGAGLDVFEHEPQIPQAMKDLENVTLSPHAGTACLSSRTNLAMESAGNITAILLDKPSRNVVN